MAKWFETMPKSAVEFWKQYLQTADLNEDVHLSDERCPIFVLKEQCRRPARDQNESSDVPSINLTFREKERAPLEEV